MSVPEQPASEQRAPGQHAPEQHAPEHPTPESLPLRWTWLQRRPGVAAEVQARGWLATELDLPAETLPLHRDDSRRPWLGAPLAARDVNWSHSGEGLLVALGESGLRVGADLEWRRPRPRAMELARRWFTEAENAWLATLADVQAREQAFLRLWCAKEAVLKADGRGIAFGLGRLSFSDGPHGLRLVECHPDLGQPRDWSLHEIAPAPDYLGALAWRPRS